VIALIIFDDELDAEEVALKIKKLRRDIRKSDQSALKEVLKYNNDAISQAKIRLDGSGNKLFRQNLINYLRKSLNSNEKQVMQNLRFRDSNKDVLIQLSDMVVGSIRRYYDAESKDYELYIKLLRARIENVKKFE
jgi:hypothetical protein